MSLFTYPNQHWQSDCNNFTDPPMSFGAQTYTNDYSWQFVSNTTDGNAARSGDVCLKCEYRGQSIISGSGYRTQMHPSVGSEQTYGNQDDLNGQVVWLGWSCYFDPAWTRSYYLANRIDGSDDGGMILIQINAGPGGPIFQWRLDMDAGAGGTLGFQDDSNRNFATHSWHHGAWHDYIVRIVMSETNTGSYQIWMDGNQIYNNGGHVTLHDTGSSHQIFSWGMYWSSRNRTSMSYKMYYDCLATAIGSDRYDDVDPSQLSGTNPGGGTPPEPPPPGEDTTPPVIYDVASYPGVDSVTLEFSATDDEGYEAPGADGRVVGVVSDTGSGDSLTLQVSNMTWLEGSAVAEDDVLIAVGFQAWNSGIDFDATYTFTDICAELVHVTGGSRDITHRSGYRVATASEPSSYDFSFDVATDCIAALIVCRGIDTATVVDAVTHATHHLGINNDSTPSAPAITPATANDLIFQLFHVLGATAPSAMSSSNSNATEVLEVPSFRRNTYITAENWDSTSEYPAGTLSAGFAGDAEDSIVQTFALKSGSEPSTPPPGPPGNRVQISNNTLVHPDTGEILRGAHGNYTNRVWTSPSWWANLKDNYGLNCLRLDTRILWPPSSCSEADYRNLETDVWANVDDCVDAAADAGFFLILDSHSCCCPAPSIAAMEPICETFWEEAAARYKDEEHVIYEIQNEPVSSGTYGSSAIQFEEDLYTYIRGQAPNTHIICWSSNWIRNETKGYVQQGTDISYTNASVGLHPYRHQTYDSNWSNLESIRSTYPTIITEFSPHAATDPEAVWDECEAEGIAWIYLDLRNGGNLGDGVADPAEWPTEKWM